MEMKLDYFIRIIALAFCTTTLVWMLQSCKTTDCIPETIVRDSIRVEQRLDSIYIYQHDSIFIKEKADTIWVEKYITRYKDVLQVRVDTIIQDNSVVEVKEVEVEKPIAGVVKWFAWIGAAFVVFYLVKIAFWVYKKFVLKV